MSEDRNSRKVRQGTVVSAVNDKTCVVQVKELSLIHILGGPEEN